MDSTGFETNSFDCFNTSCFSVYERFTMTYSSIDICRLKSSQRILLCSTALKDLHRDLIFKKPNVRSKAAFCARKKVILTSLEADDYETDQFSMIACYYPTENTPTFYLGKNHLEASAIIYKLINIREDFYYPYTLILTIDMYKLIQDAGSRRHHTRNN